MTNDYLAKSPTSDKPTTASGPVRIWLEPVCGSRFSYSRDWASYPLISDCGEAACVCKAVEYVRSDCFADMLAFLDQIEDHLQRREDIADGSYGVPEPNAEMQLLSKLRPLLARARS